MAIRGSYTGKVNSTQYTQGHIKSVLKEIGLDISGETSNDFLCYCPFHSNRHTSSFSVSKEYGAFICFNPACGESGTLIELIKRVLNKNDFQAMRLVFSKQEEALDNFEEIMAEMFKDKHDFVEFPQSKIDELSTSLTLNKVARDYFISRGINEMSMSHFELGYSENQNMVTVPVHTLDGLPIGLVGRSIEGKSFKNSTNLPKSKTLFNIHRAKKIGDHVIIVESSFDAIRVHQAGFPNVVATLGGFLSNDQHNLLNRHFNKITIMTDNDLAGRELGSGIAYKLKNKDILWSSFEYVKIYPHDAKDAGDMTDEEIKTCVKNSVSNIEYRSWNS